MTDTLRQRMVALQGQVVEFAGKEKHVLARQAVEVQRVVLRNTATALRWQAGGFQRMGATLSDWAQRVEAHPLLQPAPAPAAEETAQPAA